MLERETGHINERYRLWEEIKHGDGKVQYRHRITKRRKDIRPEEKGGGILADDMGLGKTVSMLGLIAVTQFNNRCGCQHVTQGGMEPSMRTTLVVVPLSRKLIRLRFEIQLTK